MAKVKKEPEKTKSKAKKPAVKPAKKQSRPEKKSAAKAGSGTRKPVADDAAAEAANDEFDDEVVPVAANGEVALPDGQIQRQIADEMHGLGHHQRFTQSGAGQHQRQKKCNETFQGHPPFHGVFGRIYAPRPCAMHSRGENL